MKDDLTINKAKNAAAAMLGRKMLTCKELFDRMCRKGFEKEIAEMVVSEFIEAGFLNDIEYARMYTADAMAMGAKGTFRIRRELLQKGISASVINSVIEQSEIDTADILKQYIEQRDLCGRVKSRRDLENLKARLARRGYSASEIAHALSEYEFDFEDDNRW